MKRTEHAQEIANRFRELVEESGESLTVGHYDELSLLIEAGIDAALVDYMEAVSKKLTQMAHDVQHDAEFFE